VRFSAIIFDWDGTLCQTLGLWVAAYQAALADVGYALSADEVRDVFLHHHERIDALYPGLDYQGLLRAVYDNVAANIGRTQLYRNAATTLWKLTAQECGVALVSTSSRRVLTAGLATHGIDDLFGFVLSGDEVARIKPDPEPFTTTLHALGLRAEETLVIGDNRGDILAGKAAGMQTCLFTPPENTAFHDFEDLRRSMPDFEIDDLAQILTM